MCRRCWRSSRPTYRIVVLPNGSVRQYADRWIRQQQGRARGADAIHLAGKAHRWSASTARAAALKRWKQTPVNRRIGVRLGLSTRRRKSLDRSSIRARYLNSAGEIFCVKVRRTLIWQRRTPSGLRTISERTALQRLGLLKNSRGFVPSEQQLRPYMPTPSNPVAARSTQTSPKTGIWYLGKPLATTTANKRTKE